MKLAVGAGVAPTEIVTVCVPLAQLPVGFLGSVPVKVLPLPDRVALCG